MGQSVIDYPEGEKLHRDAAIALECDIWIPAARPDVVCANNVDQLKTKLVVQGANIPFTTEAEQICHDRNILVIPDFIANAGGVICAVVEYRGGVQVIAFHTIEEKIRNNTQLVYVSRTNFPLKISINCPPWITRSAGCRPRATSTRSSRRTVVCIGIVSPNISQDLKEGRPKSSESDSAKNHDSSLTPHFYTLSVRLPFWLRKKCNTIKGISFQVFL